MLKLLKIIFKFLGIIINFLSATFYIVSGITLVVMTISVAYEVLMRYVFTRPTTWSFEICSYLFIVIVLLSTAHIERFDYHIKMGFLREILGERGTAWNNFFKGFVGTIFCIIVIWKGAEHAITAYQMDYRSSTILAFPLFPSLFVIPVGFSLWGLQFLIKMFAAIQTIIWHKPDINNVSSTKTSHPSYKGD